MTKRVKLPKRKISAKRGKGTEGKQRPRSQRLLVIMVLALVAVQVALVNSLVAGGREIKRFEVERKRLRSDIVLLENKVAQASSLTTIRKKARELGMVLGKVDFLPAPSVASVNTSQSKLTP
jgi:hypothetical protein